MLGRVHLPWARAGMAVAPFQRDPSPPQAPGQPRLTVNTRDGTGVSSRGWIMDRMEGRCPSRDPTKNSLGGDTERGHGAVTALQGPAQDKWGQPELSPGSPEAGLELQD